MNKKWLLLIFILFVFNGFAQKSVKQNFIKFHPISSSDPLDSAYSAVADSIWEHCVPSRGKSNYTAGEMLRILYNVKDEAQRNGNVNWRSDYKKGLRFIQESLFEASLFPKEIQKEIKKDIKRLKKYRRPYTQEDIYNRLVRRIVEYQWNFKNQELN